MFCLLVQIYTVLISGQPTSSFFFVRERGVQLRGGGARRTKCWWALPPLPALRQAFYALICHCQCLKYRLNPPRIRPGLRDFQEKTRSPGSSQTVRVASKKGALHLLICPPPPPLHTQKGLNGTIDAELRWKMRFRQCALSNQLYNIPTTRDWELIRLFT